jgi:hypothetical protein
VTAEYTSYDKTQEDAIIQHCHIHNDKWSMERMIINRMHSINQKDTETKRDIGKGRMTMCSWNRQRRRMYYIIFITILQNLYSSTFFHESEGCDISYLIKMQEVTLHCDY